MFSPLDKTQRSRPAFASFRGRIVARRRAVPVFGKIRLSPAQNILLGLTPKARHYIDIAMLPAIEAMERGQMLVANIETMSNRQFEQFRNEMEFGERITKEQRTRRMRRSPKGRIGYRTEAARQQADFERWAKPIRATVEGVTPADVKLMVKKNREDWSRMTADEKRRFSHLFKTYNRRQVFEALGSPPTR